MDKAKPTQIVWLVDLGSPPTLDRQVLRAGRQAEVAKRALSETGYGMRLIRFVCAVGLWACVAFLGVGCSSFGPSWKEAAGMEPGPHGIAGRWDGEWVSDVNGHRGRLRAVVKPLGGVSYRAEFRASYRGWLRFGYGMDMEVTPAGSEACLFTGAADLGVWGDYTCEGAVRRAEFTARYETQQDRGTFGMRRVDP